MSSIVSTGDVRSQVYRNPVIPGFHPDPSVCRVGKDYYLVCSSFEYFPGVPLFHSRDLVNWRQIGNVLDRPSQLSLASDLYASGGVYAPTIRHHDGRFWMITTDVSGRGNFLVTATDPAGPWSDPVWIDLPGIDPSLAWDEDGTCWCSVSGIRIARIDPHTGQVLDEPQPVWSGTGLQYPEGPHLYQIDGWWYLLLSEGGTHSGHCLSIARARSPLGPFEPAPDNPILTYRSTNWPVQATGHADLVQAVDGSWWLVLLGIRQRGFHPGYHVLGRETFLTRVDWVNGWPVVAPVELVAQAPPGTPPGSTPTKESLPERDDFASGTLAPGWISPRQRPDHCWSLTERSGWLTLHATGPSLDRPGATLLGQRQRHHDCKMATRVDPGTSRCGMSARIDEAHHYDLEISEGVARVIARIGPASQVVAERAVPVDRPLTLVIETRTTDPLPPSVISAEQAADGPCGVAAAGPDTLSFQLEGDGEGDSVVLAEMDGRYLSTEACSGFTGRVVGLYVTEGSAAFDWFDYQPVTRTEPADT